MSTSNFFKKSTESQFVDVGGTLFYALAVALIDGLKEATFLNNIRTQKILESFVFHFPQYKTTYLYSTPAERLRLIIHQPKKSELVACMAYVIRQLTVDELLINPVQYSLFFDSLATYDSIQSLRHPGYELPIITAVLAACAYSLQVKISLSIKEEGKELGKKQEFSPHTDAPGMLHLLVQEQKNYFIPRVKNKEDFTYVGHLAVIPPQPILKAEQYLLTDAMDAVDAYKKELLHHYKSLYKQLFSLYQTGELSKDTLLALYIEYGLSDNNSTHWFTLFQHMNKAHSSLKIVDTIGSSQEETVKLLINAIAALICVHQIDAELFFDKIELMEKRTRVPLKQTPPSLTAI